MGATAILIALFYFMNMQRFFRDSQGKIIIVQKPNLPLIVWFVSFVVARLPLHAMVLQLAGTISFGALFTWAWMEIFSGVNMWRRLLGSVVMAWLLWTGITP